MLKVFKRLDLCFSVLEKGMMHFLFPSEFYIGFDTKLVVCMFLGDGDIMDVDPSLRVAYSYWSDHSHFVDDSK
jgi:hypothetical protein